MLHQRLGDASIAILDISLGGRRSFPVAALLHERGVKIIFASGYGSPELERRSLTRSWSGSR